MIVLFRAHSLAEFPGCRVARQGYKDEVAESYQNMMESLFDFTLKLTTDELAPRGKRGNLLIMGNGMVAEDGDIVAVASCRDDRLLIRVELYAEGMDYFAVATGITTTKDPLNPHRQTEAPAVRVV